MRILLVGGRRWRLAADRAPQEHAAELQRDLTAAGHAVALLPAPTRAVPAFRRVGATLGESLVERDVAMLVREHEPHVALVCGLGAGSSVRLPWVMAALGIPCALEVELAAVACHRGDLRFLGREPCSVTHEPARCATCCMAAASGGLTRLAALGARGLAWLGTSSPFPNAAHLRNRRDEVLAALEDANLILARSDAEAARLVEYGADARRVRVVAGATAAERVPALVPLLRGIARGGQPEP